MNAPICPYISVDGITIPMRKFLEANSEDPERSHSMNLIQIQEKQIAAELAAVARHGNTAARRRVIFAARTRSRTAIQALGYQYSDALRSVTDAADVAQLRMLAQ